MESSHMMASSYCTCTKEGPKCTPEAQEEKVVVGRAGELWKKLESIDSENVYIYRIFGDCMKLENRKLQWCQPSRVAQRTL